MGGALGRFVGFQPNARNEVLRLSPARLGREWCKQADGSPWRAIAILAKLHRYSPPQPLGIPRNQGEEMLSSLQEDFNIWVKSVKLKSQVPSSQSSINR
jgi:hypothetical protein